MEGNGSGRTTRQKVRQGPDCEKFGTFGMGTDARVGFDHTRSKMILTKTSVTILSDVGGSVSVRLKTS